MSSKGAVVTEACPHCKASHCKAHDCGEHATADQVTVCRLRNECWDLRAGLELAEQAIAAAEARADAAEREAVAWEAMARDTEPAREE